MMDFTDIDADQLEVGQPMRMMFRIKESIAQRGFLRYFWKAAPADPGAGRETCMATGIRDKVAILGMGCSKFGERWDSDAEELMVEAYRGGARRMPASRPSRSTPPGSPPQIEEQHVGKSAVPLAVALRLPYIPVTRVENYCASGTEAFRGAVYAVASGAADIALALGVEKLKDTGYGGLPQRGRGTLNDMTGRTCRRPGNFAQLAAAYRAKHGSRPEDLKRAMAHISVKSHDNGAKNPKAHLRNTITDGDSAECADDGRAARPLRLLRRVRRRRLRDRDHAGDRAGARQEDLVAVKALQLSVSNGLEAQHNSWDGSYFARPRGSPPSAPIRKPASSGRASEINLLEVHDCFSVTELVTMEDLHISAEGNAIRDVLDGFYDADGTMPCQIDGGLKCFGHPIGASGLRDDLRDVPADARAAPASASARRSPRLGMTHNLGGFPHQNVCSISIIGRYGS